MTAVSLTGPDFFQSLIYPLKMKNANPCYEKKEETCYLKNDALKNAFRLDGAGGVRYQGDRRFSPFSHVVFFDDAEHDEENVFGK